MDTPYNNKFRKALFEKINGMTKTEHEEIFKIIRSNNNDAGYSKNKNGVFFNMSSLDSGTISKIDNFVEYCMKNKKDLDDYDKKINECKINNNLVHIVPRGLEDVTKPIIQTEDWASIANEPKSIQKITQFIEKLMTDYEKIGKKKVNQKFSNAKKKYSKKACVERKFETEDNVEVVPDVYLISAR